MKKIALIVAILLVFALTVGAQDKVTGVMAKGIKAGLNIAGHSGDDTDEHHKNLMGAAFGGFLQYNVAEQFAIQPEVLYMMKGAEWEDGDDTWKGKYNYLEVPILFKFLIPTQGSVQPNIFVGPSVGFLLSANEEWDYEGETGDEDVKDYLKSTDVGLAFGAGAAFTMGQGQLMLDVRYTMGMTKIYEAEANEVDPDAGEPEIKSKAISFMVGYGF